MPPVLYEFSPTRSNRAKWALEELGIAYESQPVPFPENAQRSAEHMALHPLGHVPAYRTESYVMHESIAITLQVLDENPDAGLAPVPGSPERASYYQWCLFAGAEMDSNLFDVMKHTMHLPEADRNTEIARRGTESLARRADVLCAALNGRAYLLGDQFSGADIAIGYCMNWLAYVDLLNGHPRLVEYYGLLRQRQAFQRVFQSG